MLKKFLILIFGAMALTGCSSLVESTRRSLLGEDSPRKKNQEVKWVSKAQYDDLMNRYRNLNERYEKLKDEKIQSSQSGYNQVDELTAKGQAPAPSAGETVDVFAKNGLADQAVSSVKKDVPAPQLNKDEVGQELEYYKKAVALKLNGKIDEALKIFQYLERSSTEQVRVRARAHIGDIYMQKGQFDLALQVFETIIRKDAFSGKTLVALEKAVVCCEKLNLDQKKMKYQSILRDFFEIES